jgi:hypothetical protein
VHEAMEAQAATDGRVHVVDLAGWVATTGLDTDRDARPDGVHWAPDASTRIATDYLGEQILRAVLLGEPSG